MTRTGADADAKMVMEMCLQLLIFYERDIMTVIVRFCFRPESNEFDGMGGWGCDVMSTPCDSALICCVTVRHQFAICYLWFPRLKLIEIRLRKAPLFHSTPLRSRLSTAGIIFPFDIEMKWMKLHYPHPTEFRVHERIEHWALRSHNVLARANLRFHKIEWERWSAREILVCLWRMFNVAAKGKFTWISILNEAGSLNSCAQCSDSFNRSLG